MISTNRWEKVIQENLWMGIQDDGERFCAASRDASAQSMPVCIFLYSSQAPGADVL
jgi:hypothetical protein